jgi:putative DNA primase/helicase
MSAPHANRPVDVALAAQMLALYPCSQRGYARWDKEAFNSATGKTDVNYRFVREPVTDQTWLDHLTGRYSIVLGLACDDGTASVVVLDVDDRKIDDADVQRRVDALDLPLYVRLSKSLGLHVTAFLDAPVPVEAARAFGRGLARRLGLPDDDKPGSVEIFPKPQSSDPEKLPKGLNMPYGRGGGFIRPGARICAQMAIEEFLRGVKRVTAAQFEATAAPKPRQQRRRKSATATGDGAQFAAQCLSRYAEELRALPQGTRNETLNKRAFHMGTMVARGWIERDAVEQALADAANHGGDQTKTWETLRRALDDGQRSPHPDLDVDVVTEDSAALEFVNQRADDLRYDHDAGCWHRWTGTHWQADRTQLAFSWARDLARELAQAQSVRGRYITSKVSFASSVERFARADQRIVTTQGSWDLDPLLLGTPGGVVDLRTGALREAIPGDMITKLTAVAPADKAVCPTWLGFLDRVTGRSEELRNYIQRVSGYALTGLTTEHAMFFNYGTGANGKSVLMSTIAGILLDYHRAAPIETFTVSNTDRHPTELAGLRGARLVVVTETEEGRRWAQSRIAQITGGDVISARFMRQDFFDFLPQFKLWISGNHKPSLRSVNEAIQRRMNMLPFAVTIPKEERDPNLSEKLKAEWPGILRWMIEGCLSWQERGLAPPKIVTDATADYFESEDVIAAWIADCCDRVKSEWQSIEKLHASFKVWAAESEEYDGGKKWLGKCLEDRGFARQKRREGRGHVGLRVRGDRQASLPLDDARYADV